MKQNTFFYATKGTFTRILWFVLLLLTSSCTTSTKDQISLLENSSCDLPCWNNIIPGETSEQVALQEISNLSIIDQESIQFFDEQWNIFDKRVTFSFLASKGGADVYTKDGLIKDLYLCGNFSTSIGEMTKEIGEPEKIISGGSITGGRDVILINPTKGVSYFYNTREFPEEIEFEITPDIEVECIHLFDPTYFTEVMEFGMFSMGHYNAEETLRVIYSWDGYGNLDKKYPPRQP